jgi:hypothetical protein
LQLDRDRLGPVDFNEPSAELTLPEPMHGQERQSDCQNDSRCRLVYATQHQPRPGRAIGLWGVRHARLWTKMKAAIKSVL